MILRDEYEWARDVFGHCDLGHERNRRRLIDVGARLARQPEASLAAACGTDKAALLGGYRLIENDRVAADAIAAGGFAATAERVGDASRLLAASDTTTLSYSHAVASELGDVGGPEQSEARGWQVHSSLLINGDNYVSIGLIDQQWRSRDPSGRGRKHQRKQRPYEEKESFKWQATSEQVADRLGEAMSRVIELCDAEADVYEFLTYKLGREQRFIVRIAQDRRLTDADEKLWNHLERRPALGRLTVHVKQKGGRRARDAKVTLRAATVELCPPSRSKGAASSAGDLRELTLQAVLVEELNPPDGVEPLRWRLYTTESAATFEDAALVVKDYQQRWQMEEFHKAWKSGAKVEEQRQQTPDNLRRMAQIRAFVAMRLLRLKQYAALAPEYSCAVALDEVEWKCLWLTVETKKPLPKEAPSLHWALMALARLGGFYDSKRTGRPGWVALMRGWRELQSRLAGYHLAQSGEL